jgi:tRNA threonylcarbamoyladenosine biosynthesis protein TsaE
VSEGIFTTHAPAETFELARRIGEKLKGGEVFLLEGDLGAGKTVFAKGIGAGLQIDPAEVSSPTFTIINQLQGRLKLTHLDLFRISGNYDELRELGIDEILEDDSGVIVIEWPDRLSGRVLQGACLVKINDQGANNRLIELSRSGA